MKTEKSDKVILWTYIDNSIHALIPKKIGKGFLKQPYGHHRNELLEKFRYEIDLCDLYGLDGSLQIMINRYYIQEQNLEFGNSIMSKLSGLYQYKHKYVSESIFWNNHPLS